MVPLPFAMLLLLLLAADVNAEACVDACTVCNCWELTLGISGYISCNDIALTSIPCGLLSDTTTLDLSGNNLTALSANDVLKLQALTGLSSLRLDRNQLTTIPLLSLPAMSLLNMSQNAFTSIPPKAFALLPSLTSIDLSSCAIQQVDSTSFMGATKLQILALHINQLTSLSHVTDALPNLQYLFLNDNQLTNVNEIGALQKLFFLHLENNLLTAFPPFNSPKLQALFISHNLISELPPTAFQNTPSLVNMDLSSNLFTVLAESVFSSLSKLQYLQLSFVQLGSLPPLIFSNCTLLANLYLDNTGLTQLDPLLFSNLTNLRYLYLDSNGITQIPPGIFNNLKALNILGLSLNAITSLPDNLFDSLTSIQTLSLQGNRLSGVPLTVMGLTSLTILDLSGNNIYSLAPFTFSRLTKLSELYFRSNSISSLDLNVLPSPSSLIILDVQYNAIATVAEGVLAQLLPRLAYLNMTGNPSDCTFGRDVHLAPVIYCDCARGYVSRQPDSCLPLSDVIISSLPPRIAPGQEYVISVPSSLLLTQLQTTCGTVSRTSQGLVIDTTQFGTSTQLAAPTCNLKVNNTVLWNMQVVNKQFNATVNVPVLANIQLTVGQSATVVAPDRLAFLSTYSDEPHTVYQCDGCDEANVFLDEQSGLISVTASIPLSQRTLSFFLADTFTHNQVSIGTVQLKVDAQPTTNELSTGAQIAIGVGIGGGLLVIALFVFLLVLLIRERRLRALKPHNFNPELAQLAAFQVVKDGFREPNEIIRELVTSDKIIGQGQFGSVSRGTVQTGDPERPTVVVAIKSSLLSQANRESMIREAALLAQFSHRNVVSLYGVVTSGDPLLILMEYCASGSLYDYLRSNDVLDDLKHRIAADCAEGMQYLSHRGFVHRDLASRNVLLTDDKQAKIADFGMSRASVHYQSSTTQLPIRWTAPEALEQQIFNQQSDCWSFGVLMYEIWTRAALPYSSLLFLDDVVVQVRAGLRLQKPENCPDKVYEVMSKCWAANGERPSFGDLAWSLRELARLAAPPAPPAPPADDALNEEPINGNPHGALEGILINRLDAELDANEQEDDQRELHAGHVPTPPVTVVSEELQENNTSSSSNLLAQANCSDSQAFPPSASSQHSSPPSTLPRGGIVRRQSSTDAKNLRELRPAAHSFSSDTTAPPVLYGEAYKTSGTAGTPGSNDSTLLSQILNATSSILFQPITGVTQPSASDSTASQPSGSFNSSASPPSSSQYSSTSQPAFTDPVPAQPQPSSAEDAPTLHNPPVPHDALALHNPPTPHDPPAPHNPPAPHDPPSPDDSPDSDGSRSTFA